MPQIRPGIVSGAPRGARPPPPPPRVRTTWGLKARLGSIFASADGQGTGLEVVPLGRNIEARLGRPPQIVRRWFDAATTTRHRCQLEDRQ